jgi:hypothetical protein
MLETLNSLKQLLILALCAASILGCNGTAGVKVGVHNNSGLALNSVTIQYTGGAMQVGPLATGERKTVLIKPAGDSHIELKIVPVAGKTEQRMLNTYMGVGYQGTIEITLNRGMSVQHTEHLTLR